MEPNFAHAWLHVHFAFYPIFCKMFLWNGLIQKKSKQGGLRIWNFQGYQKNSMCNFQGLIKNEVEFPRIFVFGLGISKGSNTIL